MTVLISISLWIGFIYPMYAVSQINSMERRSQRRHTRAHNKGFIWWWEEVGQMVSYLLIYAIPSLLPRSSTNIIDCRVQNQRVFYKYFLNGDTKHIKQHRIAALANIGFIWDVYEHQWILIEFLHLVFEGIKIFKFMNVSSQSCAHHKSHNKGEFHIWY